MDIRDFKLTIFNKHMTIFNKIKNCELLNIEVSMVSLLILLRISITFHLLEKKIAYYLIFYTYK